MAGDWEEVADLCARRAVYDAGLEVRVSLRVGDARYVITYDWKGRFKEVERWLVPHRVPTLWDGWVAALLFRPSPWRALMPQKLKAKSTVEVEELILQEVADAKEAEKTLKDKGP